MRLILDLNELSGETYVVPALAKAVLQYILHRKIASNLIQAYAFVFVSHDGRSRDHIQLFRVEPA